MWMAKLDLEGRVVLITGGANGIGFATAAAARRRGATVALLDLDGELAAKRADELGGGSIGLTTDVTDLRELETAVAEVLRHLGGIDVLVANAGIGPRTTTVASGDRVHQRRLLDVNLHGVWHTMWAAADHVVERRGHIVLISSIAAYILTPGWAAYAAGKAAVEQLGRSMRIELAPTGTTVGVAHFGLIDTDLVREFETDPISIAMERILPNALRRKSTPTAAAEVLIRDIERRRPRTIYPPRWRQAYLLRGVLGPLGDALVARHRPTRALMAETRSRDLAVGTDKEST